MAVAITIVCVVVLMQFQSLNAADEVKGPKVTEKVSDIVSVPVGDFDRNVDVQDMMLNLVICKMLFSCVCC